MSLFVLCVVFLTWVCVASSRPMISYVRAKLVLAVASATVAAVMWRRQRATRAIRSPKRKQPKAPRQNAQGQNNPNFFAPRDKAGNLSINLRFIDIFLRWDCGRLLLDWGLFPNTQEITESMACLETIRERLPEVPMSSSDVIAVVIGDGRTPRTAALLSMRTKWHVLSIDPALHGLEPAGRAPPCEENAPCTVVSSAVPSPDATSYATLPKELRCPKLEEQEKTNRAVVKRAKMRDALATLDRLSILPLKAQEVSVRLTAAQGSAHSQEDQSAACEPPAFPLSPFGRVILLLPHAHVTPDDALRCLRFDKTAQAAYAASGRSPIISVIQLPCCGYVFHDLAINGAPDLDFMEPRIATSARCVRVWRDVASRFDFSASLHGRGVPKQVMHIADTKARRRAAQTQTISSLARV